MTEKELLAIFERHGVRPIAAAGQPFDPHVHEALFEMPDPSVPQGTVVQVMQAGYAIHDRTLRPARVGIARGGPKPGAQPAPEAGPEPAPAPAPEAAPEPASATAEAPGPEDGPSLIAEDDGVIQFPARNAAYRKPEDAEITGTRVDEDS
jgi:molecular chaperone GrpE